VGLALRHKMLFDVRFSTAFLKMLVGGGVSLDLLEEVDPDLHQSLEWLLREADSTKCVEAVFSVTETDEIEECDGYEWASIVDSGAEAGRGGAGGCGSSGGGGGGGGNFLKYVRSPH